MALATSNGVQACMLWSPRGRASHSDMSGACWAGSYQQHATSMPHQHHLILCPQPLHATGTPSQQQQIHQVLQPCSLVEEVVHHELHIFVAVLLIHGEVLAARLEGQGAGDAKVVHLHAEGQAEGVLWAAVQSNW